MLRAGSWVLDPAYREGEEETKFVLCHVKISQIKGTLANSKMRDFWTVLIHCINGIRFFK